MGNLGPNVTKDDIVQLFGLESTPLIKKTSKVELNLGDGTDQNEKHAVVTVLEDTIDAYLKFNGLLFDGKQTIVEYAEKHNIPNAAISITLDEQDGDAQESDDDEISHMEIDTRRWEWYHDVVKKIEIIRAIEYEHSDDFTKSIKEMRPPLNGIYKLDSDDFERYKDKSIEVRGVTLPITPRLKKKI